MAVKIPIESASIKKLKASLSASSSVVTPDSPNYAESLTRWSAAAEKPAGLVVFPASVEDVSKTVLFATSHKLDLAVCGGGHGTSGSASSDGGVVIDLSRMRAVSVDPHQKTITAQGGALWSDVDAAAGKHGLATVGGTVSHTGIGGLTLGGGYGWLTPKYGLAIDNLLEVEFVLADGSVVRTSESENPDLFWAARGAGASFGVATSFVYRAHEEKDDYWGGMLIFPPTVLADALEFANKCLNKSEEKAMMVVLGGAPPPAHQPVVIAAVSYLGSEEEGKAFYGDLLKLGPLVNTTKAMPYPELNSMMNAGMDKGSRRSMKGSAFLAPINTTFAVRQFEDYLDFITKLPDAKQSVIAWEFVPYGKILQVPQTATSFGNRGAYGNILFGPAWTSPENDNSCREWTRTMATKSRAELERRKAEGTDGATEVAAGEYANYDSLNAPGQVLFGVNFPRLAALKVRYDPNNVFGSGPKLLVSA